MMHALEPGETWVAFPWSLGKHEWPSYTNLGHFRINFSNQETTPQMKFYKVVGFVYYLDISVYIKFSYYCHCYCTFSNSD